MNSHRKLISLDDSQSGLSWGQFEGLVYCLQEDLHQVYSRFEQYVKEINQRERTLDWTRDLLNELEKTIDKYEDGVAKLNGYRDLISERVKQVETVLATLEHIQYDTPHSVNITRVAMYDQLVKFHDTFLQDVKSMSEVKSALKQLDELMIKVHGIENIKTNLNGMINLISFMNKAVDQMENDMRQEMKKME
ncbi:hypothetical protein WDU94_004849 [Cyamophila willieti]